MIQSISTSQKKTNQRSEQTDRFEGKLRADVDVSLEVPRMDRILPCLLSKMPGIVAETPVMLAYLFGSVAEGHALFDSDVDIALILEPDCRLSRYERMQLEFSVAEKVERYCQVREADVRCVDRAPLTVQGSIITRGVLLFSRDEEFRVEYEVYTRKRYFDFLPVAKKMQRAFFKSLSQEGLVVGRSR